MRLLLLIFFTFSLAAESVVITVHGYMRTHKSMHKLAHELDATVYHFEYPSRTKTIDENASALSQFINEVDAKHPNCEMHFVTHSLGGIILRKIASTLPSNVSNAILLAPPNQGSRLGKVLSPLLKTFGRGAGRELARRDFSDLGEFPSTIDVIVIAGTFGFNPLIAFPNDGKVALHETHLKTPHKLFKVRACHSMIMCNSQVIKIISEELHAQSSNRSNCILGRSTSK